MKRELRSIVYFIVLLLAALGIVAGCTNTTTPSLYNPNATGLPTPVIDSISPPGSVLAAATPITIYGKNFSATPANNMVFFGSAPGTVLSSTATQLVVRTPVDSLTVPVKVAVVGADKFSVPVNYRLIVAVEPFATNMAAITPGDSGKIYANALNGGNDDGIAVFAADGSRSVFAPKTAGTTYWYSLKLGPGGTLYAVKSARAVYTFAAGGGAAATLWKAVTASGLTLVDIDFDASHNLWAGGKGPGLYCFKPDASFKMSAFNGFVHALRVYNGSLYFAATAAQDSVEKVYSAPITGDSLGTITTYFDLGGQLGSSYTAHAMTFSADGYLYIGTQTPAGVVVVAPDRSYTTPYSSYGNLLGAQIFSMAWGEGDKLYMTNDTWSLIVAHTQKSSAPYLGVQ